MHGALFASLVVASFGCLATALLVYAKNGQALDADLPRIANAATSRERDLAIVSVSADTYLIFQVGMIVICSGLAVFFLGLVGLSLLGLLTMLAFIFVGFVSPRVWLQNRVRLEREKMATAVGALEELAAMAVAGGSEIGFALRTAAGFGSGRSWQRFRAAAHASLYSTSTFSEELNTLAEVYESVELQNLAGLLSAAEDGGLSQSSLEELASSQGRSESRAKMDRAGRNLSLMVIPVGLLFGSFALFIGILVTHVLSEVQI